MRTIFTKPIVFLLTTLIVVGSVYSIAPHPVFAQDFFESIVWLADSGFTALFTTAAELVLQFTALLTTISGTLLNAVVYHTVVQISNNYENLSPIKEAWRVIRDLANITFIFVLLYSAIRTILGQGENNKKVIVTVVVVAALMNFSLFFTKVVIDIANVLALAFYDAVAPGAATSSFFSEGIADAFMKHLGLPGLYQIQNEINTNGVIMTGIMGSILLSVVSFSFFTIAFMLIIRYVVLILVMILSPVFFIGFALPSGTGIGKYKDQWLDALMGQAFFAPIYFLLTWVALRVMNGVLGALNSGSPLPANAALSSFSLGQTLSSGGVLMFLNFGITIVLMFASVIIAKEWADKTGGGMNKLTSWVTGKAANLVGGYNRNTIGRLAQYIASDDKLKERAATSAIARLQLAASRKVAGSTFDVRGLSDKVGGGQAQKGGFAQTVKEKRKAEIEYAKSLGPSARAVEEQNAYIEEAEKKTAAEQKKLREIERERATIQEEREQAEAVLRNTPGDAAAEAALEEIRQRRIEAEENVAYNDNAGTRATLAQIEQEEQEAEEAANNTAEREAAQATLEEINERHDEVEARHRQQEEKTRAVQEEEKKQRTKVEEWKRSEAGRRAGEYAKGMELGKRWLGMSRRRVYGVGEVTTHAKETAAEIRNTFKKKTPKDKMAEAAREFFREEREQEEREERGGEEGNSGNRAR